MRNWCLALLLLVAPPALAAPPPITGDWVLRAGSVSLILIHVERLANGDAGTISRPRSMTFGSGQRFEGLEGPAFTQRITAAIHGRLIRRSCFQER